MLGISNRADVLLDHLIETLGNCTQPIIVTKDSANYAAYIELCESNYILANIQNDESLIIQNVTPSGLDHQYSVCTIKNSIGIPIISLDADTALRTLKPPVSPAEDDDNLEAYQELAAEKLINCQFADNRVYYIANISSLGKKYLREPQRTRIIDQPSTLPIVDARREEMQPLEQHTNMKEATIFISYSWDNEEHKEWVFRLATWLQSRGMEVLLDKDIRFGERIPNFMEQSLSKADFVLVICTPTYRERADNRIGGVGYESNIISSDIYFSNNAKYIPLLRCGSWKESLPSFMASIKGIDCRNGIVSEDSLGDLLKQFND